MTESLFDVTPGHTVMHRLAQVRESQGLSVMDMSRHCGVRHGQIRKWEEGEAEPRLSSLLAYLHVLGLRLEARTVTADDSAATAQHRGSS